MLLAMLSASLTLAPAGAASPVLAADNTIRGTSPAVLDVELIKPASILINGVRSPNVDISGAGRVTGFVLTRPAADTGRSEMIKALQFGVCWDVACAEPDPPFASREYVVASNTFARTPERGGDRYTLAPGHYELYLITDGAPIEIHLHLDGILGEAILEPVEPAPLDLRTVDPTLTFPAGVHPVYSAGGTATMSAPKSLMFHILRAELSPNVAFDNGACYYRNRQPPAGLYVPGCPGSSGPAVNFLWVFPAVRASALHYGSAVALVRGDWNQGVYFDSVSGFADFRLVLGWLDLRRS